MEPRLQIQGLTVEYESPNGEWHPAATEVSFELRAGQVMGVLGESGCGKTTTALALLGLLPANGRVARGSALFKGRELLQLSEGELQRVRGAQISMIFQEPAVALNPVMRVGEQIADVLAAHSDRRLKSCRGDAEGLLREVGFQDVRRIFAAFPHQLSGGQRQRVSIAQGLACRPEVLIADEPTSSLDATAQEEILALLRELKGRLGMTMLFISHRPAILEALADRIVVMHGGRVVEEGPVRQILNHPAHLYTQTLLECDRNRQRFAPPGTPALAGRSVDPSRPWSGSEQPAPDRREQRALLRVCGLYKSYLQGRGLFGKRYAISALHGVDLEIPRGETLVLAGESGSGKSTLARCMAGLEKIDAGEVWLEGKTLARLGPRELAGVRRQVQLVFQDSAAALNPQMTAAEIVAEPLVIQKAGTPQEQRATALERMEQVGLARAWADRRPLEFSGGQRQRLAIARALTLHPKLLILDEALSGLDLLTQLQIVRLLQELQAKHQLTYLFITHDVGLAQRLGGEIVVMRDGQIVPRGADAPADAQPASKSVSPLAGRAIKPAEAG